LHETLHQNVDYTRFVSSTVLYERWPVEAASPDVVTSRLTRHSALARQCTKRLPASTAHQKCLYFNDAGLVFHGL